MSERATLQVIDGEGGLPVYPFAPDLRLPTHHFVTFLHRRYLRSRFYLQASPAVRAIGLELFFLAQDETPIGTLPDDDDMLARLVRLDHATWTDLRRHTMSPLYQWFRCTCGDRIRLTHPVVLEVVQEALSQREAHQARSAEGRERMRLKRLAETIAKIGQGRLAQNPAYVEKVAARLEAVGEAKWTAAAVERILEEFSNGF